jgi:hypothetical protein
MKKRNIRRRGSLVATLSLTVLLIGCEQTTISDIGEDPDKYTGDPVTVVGEVISPVAGEPPGGAFEIDDGTGRIWVMSLRLDAPAPGTRLAVTGLVEPAENLGGTTSPMVLHETMRREGE